MTNRAMRGVACLFSRHITIPTLPRSRSSPILGVLSSLVSLNITIPAQFPQDRISRILVGEPAVHAFRLKNLIIHSASSLPPTSLSFLSAMPNLETLSLAVTQTSRERYPKFPGIGMFHPLQRIPSTILSLGLDQVEFETTECVAALHLALPNLHSIRLFNLRVPSDIQADFWSCFFGGGGLPNLMSLDIRTNKSDARAALCVSALTANPPPLLASLCLAFYDTNLEDISNAITILSGCSLPYLDTFRLGLSTYFCPQLELFFCPDYSPLLQMHWKWTRLILMHGAVRRGFVLAVRQQRPELILTHYQPNLPFRL